MNSTNLKDIDVDISTQDFRSIEGNISPDVRGRGNFMPGQSLFDFSSKSINDRIISAKGTRQTAYSPLKKHHMSQASTLVSRKNSFINKEFKTVSNNMMKKN